MKFIKLKCHPRSIAGGEECMIYVNVDLIRTIQQVTYDGTWTVVKYLDDQTNCVLETPEEILELLNDDSPNMQMNMSFPDIFGGKK